MYPVKENKWWKNTSFLNNQLLFSKCHIYAEYIKRNAGLDEAQAGITIARRNINNLRYADYPTLLAESEEELKTLLMKVKEESDKVGLKLTKPTKVHLVKAMVFPVVMYGCESWTVKKAERWRIDAFEL